MIRVVLVCTLCAVLSSSWLENVHAQLGSEQDIGSIVQSIETLSEVVQGLQTEIQMQSSMLSNLVSKDELESILLNNLVTKSDMQMHDTSFKNLEAKAATQDNSLRTLRATVDELKTLLINSNVKTDEQMASVGNSEAQSNMQTILLNKIGANLENQTSLLNNYLTKKEIQANNLTKEEIQANNLTKEEIQVNNLTNIEANATTFSDGMETLAEGIENLTASNGIVEGIIAGTYKGVVIIPLNSREHRKISSKETRGVAFNWQSREVYWIESEVGVKIAYLNGSDVKVIISDPRNLRGLAIDQITGNLYYGVQRPNPEIRVCDSMGKKCVTIASGVYQVGSNIWDIALFPSQGLMFWTKTWSTESVTRANMDGTNATVIISKDVNGMQVDELTQKLYLADFYGQSIGHSDLNGYNRHVLLNTTMKPVDIAVDGDTLYFSGTEHYGIYSVTSNRQVSSIANTTDYVSHIVFYGRNQVFSWPNPCSNSPCENLCVLTGLSHTCL